MGAPNKLISVKLTVSGPTEATRCSDQDKKFGREEQTQSLMSTFLLIAEGLWISEPQKFKILDLLISFRFCSDSALFTAFLGS